MIGYFPDPYEGELFYSICARFADRTRLPDFRRVLEALFGDPNVVPTVDLPNHLEAMLKSLPPGHRYTVDELIDRHTLFPAYGPFLRAENFDLVRENMKGSGFRTTQLQAGIVTGGVRIPKWMRCCPVCDRDNLENYGETYWHRLHQMPGVEVCPEHRVLLEDTEIPRRTPRSRHIFIPARGLVNTAEPRRIDTANRDHAVLLRMAKDFRWLLDQTGLRIGLDDIHRRYQRLLVQQDLATAGGQVRIEDLRRRFLDHFSPHVLAQLQSEVPEEGSLLWLGRLVRKPRGIQAPVRHLLLMQFLGVKAEEFFSMEADEKEPDFGSGPFPCVNPLCPGFRQAVIQNHQMRFSRYTNKWSGQFTCGCCGQAYERYLGDPDDQVRIIDRGDMWRALLREQWANPKVGICVLADKLDVDPLTAKRHAVKLGLPFPRNYKGRKTRKPIPGKGGKGFPSELERQRKRWTDLMARHPRNSRSQLRRLKSALYTWLYRHDRAWLADVCPASVNPTRKQPRVDWGRRDIEFAEKIQRAAKEMSDQPDRSVRITANELGRRSGTHAFLHRHLDKLPKVREVLSCVVESIEAFAIRRIETVRDEFLANGERPTRSQFMYRAGLSNKVKQSADVQAAIEDALQRLRDTVPFAFDALELGSPLAAR